MAKTTLNQADFSGLYGEDEVPVTFVSNQVTTIVEGLTATLSAHKRYQVDGALVYTIVVENKSGEKYAKGVLADKLDTANVVFDDEYGVEIDGEKTSDYTFTGGVLSVNLPDVSDGSSLTVTFQVTQA